MRITEASQQAGVTYLAWCLPSIPTSSVGWGGVLVILVLELSEDFVRLPEQRSYT